MANPQAAFAFASTSTSAAGPSVPRQSNMQNPETRLSQNHTSTFDLDHENEPDHDTTSPQTPAGPSGIGIAALGPLVEPQQDLNDFLESFWTRQMEFVERDEPDFKTYPLPLARIKKVMKSDEVVKMISAEAPIMFSKACEIFISELTCRAWLIAESNKRRTLQKSDVAAAIALSDMFDFLIDIVPRDDPPGTENPGSAVEAPTGSDGHGIGDTGANHRVEDGESLGTGHEQNGLQDGQLGTADGGQGDDEDFGEYINDR